VIAPVQSHYYEGSPVSIGSLRWEGFVEKVSFDIGTLIRPLLDCALQQSGLLAMGTPLRKALTTDVGQMQQWRHHMTTWSLTL